MNVVAYSSKASRIVQEVPCPCGRWVWNKVHVANVPGFSATDDYCRKCESKYLLVFRTDETGMRFVKAVPLDSLDAYALRRSLARIPGATPDDREFMLASALAAANPAG